MSEEFSSTARALVKSERHLLIMEITAYGRET